MKAPTHHTARLFNACIKPMRLMRALLITGLSALAMGASATDWSPDYPIGAEIIPIQAIDHTGQEQTLEQLMGEEGLVLMFTRSALW